MKVALCHHYSITYSAGGEKFLITLIKSLGKSGFKTKLHALPFLRNPDVSLSQLLDRIEYEEKWHHNVDADVAYFIYAPLVIHLFRCHCPKIASVHAFALAPELQSKEALPRNPLEFLKIHGRIPTAAYYSKPLMNSELKVFDAIHKINPNMTLEHKRIFNISNWVDTDYYKPTREKDRDFTILFVGRKQWKKGNDTFLKVAQYFKKYNPKIKFVAAGRSRETASQGLVEDRGFLFGKDLLDLYSSAHIVLCPSRVDVCSLVILEALASGTPVVTTNIPAHKLPHLPLFFASTVRETVKHVLALYDLFSKNQEKYYELAEKSREAVKKFYSARVLLPQFEQMLVEISKEN